MNYEDFKGKLNEIMTNPDDAQLRAVSFLEEVKGDYETLESLRAEKEKSDAKIKTLQDTNQRLFLMTTGQAVDDADEKEELTGENAMDDFVNSLMKGE